MANPLPNPAKLGEARRPHRLFHVDVHTAERVYESARGLLSVSTLVVQDRAGRTVETLHIDDGSLTDPALEGPQPLDLRGRQRRNPRAGKRLEFTSGGQDVAIVPPYRCACRGSFRVVERNPEETP